MLMKGKEYMTKNNNCIRKLSAGLMASLCAVSMLANPMTGMISASAASTATENEAFPSADEVIAQAATLLASPYHGEWGFREFIHPSTVLIGSTKFNMPLCEHPYSNNKLKMKLLKYFEK